MQSFSVPVVSSTLPRLRPRTAVLASSDSSFRQRLGETLTGLRWHVREAETGAQAWAEAESSAPEAVIVDSWLPDLDLDEFLREFRISFPKVDLVTAEGTGAQDGARSPHRRELLYALRKSQDGDTVAWKSAGALAASSFDRERNSDTGSGGDSGVCEHAAGGHPASVRIAEVEDRTSFAAPRVTGSTL